MNPYHSTTSGAAADSARTGRPRVPASRGAIWVLVSLVGPRLFGSLFTVILRRVLGPGASGLFDTAGIPYRFLDNFRNFGTGPALVYEKTVSRAVANTAWTMNMLAAVAITIVAQMLAHPLALYYGHPRVEGIFRLLSIAYVFASISSVHFFLLMRDLDFRARSIPALGQVIAAGTIAVLFAVWGFGVGTLVARELTSVVAGAVLLWAVYPFRPRPQLVARLAWNLFRYGAWIGLGLSILYVSQNVDVFIGARIIHSTRDIGFYTTSWSLAFIAAGTLAAVAATMVFPTLSRLQDDEERLRQTLLRSVQQQGLLMLPCAAFLAVAAPIVIVPLLGERWAAYRSSFLVLSLLSLYAGNRTMLSLFFEGYKAIGKPWLVPLYNLARLVILVPAIIVGAQHGILGLAVAYAPLQVLEIPAALVLAQRVLQVSPGDVWKAARISVLATAVMVLAVLATEGGLGRAGLGDLLSLAACVVVAPAVYLGTLMLAAPQILVEARSTLLRGL